eukprot:5245007-Pyramimonas_sp.AAC.1
MEFSAVKVGENLAESEATSTGQTKFLAAPARGEPKAEQVMARTTQNLDTGEFHEKNAVVAGKARGELTKPLPLKVNRRQHIFGRPNEVAEYDEVHGHAILRRTQKESTNPGAHPDRRFKTGGPERKRFIEEYETEKKGFDGLEDPGPNADLLSARGVDMPRPAPTCIMAAAAPSSTGQLDEDAMK